MSAKLTPLVSPYQRYAPLTFLLGVIAGTASSISLKILYSLQSRGESGELVYFEKPLMMTLLMFVSMTLAMPLYWLWIGYLAYFPLEMQEKSEREEVGITINSLSTATTSSATPSQPSTARVSWRTLFLMLIPTCFDLVASALASFGLMYTTVSVYQLVRCSNMMFTAFLRAAVREKLPRHEWIGVAIITIATILVSLMSFFPGHMELQPGIHKDPRVGILFILLSSLVQAAQYVFEEKLMKDDEVSPLLMIGVEGVWGSILMAVVVIPWAAMLPGSDADGCIENVYDTWVMIRDSSTIRSFLVFYMVSVLFYNILGVYLTFLLSAVWHAILENFRPVTIWVTDLALYYLITRGAFGEIWTKWSWMELVGMVVMMGGTVVYDGRIQFPFLEDPPHSQPSAVGAAATSDEEAPLLPTSSSSLKALPVTTLGGPSSGSPMLQRNIERERVRLHTSNGTSSMSINGMQLGPSEEDANQHSNKEESETRPLETRRLRSTSFQEYGSSSTSSSSIHHNHTHSLTPRPLSHSSMLVDSVIAKLIEKQIVEKQRADSISSEVSNNSSSKGESRRSSISVPSTSSATSSPTVRASTPPQAYPLHLNNHLVTEDFPPLSVAMNIHAAEKNRNGNGNGGYGSNGNSNNGSGSRVKNGRGGKK